MKTLFTIIISFTLCACNAQFTKYVNPFIGTGGHGHTFPGTVWPFGMVQLSPDTRVDGWDGCSGYHYTDSVILGFSHTHLSGTGIADYCDILIMPGNGSISLGEIEEGKYPVSTFKKSNERATPASYQVLLDNSKTLVQLTVTPRTGVHKYTFQSKENNWLVIDLKHRDKIEKAGFQIVQKDEIGGSRISSSWSKNQRVFFYLKFSSNIDQIKFSTDSLKMFCFFKELKNKTLTIQCSLSPVDLKGAQKNLQEEWINFNFKKAIKNCDDMWNKLLSRVNIQQPQKEDYNKLKIFYSALYHCLIHPSLSQDVDGRYYGMDGMIHQAKKNSTRYTVFSLWDTYRAAHPLYQLIYPDYNKQFVNTFLEQFKETKRLPVWELASFETYCMIGNHSIPVLANYFLQNENLDRVEKNLIIESIEKTLEAGYSNIAQFKKGFISMNESAESVSKTIENSIDFGALSEISKKYYPEKEYYKNLFNPKTGFFQSKIANKFLVNFDPREVNFNFTEANAWQYLFGAHHDIDGIIDCLNISDKKNNKLRSKAESLEFKLDELFGSSSEMNGRVQADITGLIGQYAHGNEPSHHVAYLYNYCNRNDKTQKLVQQIMDSFYTNKPEGLCGNEDCGQMSAWYVFSSLGFYPVNPITGTYQTGIPQFKNVELFPGGNQKMKLVSNKNDGSKWVYKIVKNNVESDNEIKLRDGDKVEFLFSNVQYLKAKNSNTRIGNINDVLPYLEQGDDVFIDSTSVVLSSINEKTIQYTFDTLESIEEYHTPLVIRNQKKLFFRTIDQIQRKPSKWIYTEFKPKPDNLSYCVTGQFDSQYSAGGKMALADGKIGSTDFRDGRWQGYWGQDIEIDIKINEKVNPEEISIGCLQDQGSWILLPKRIEIYVQDKNTGAFVYLDSISHKVPTNLNQSLIHIFKIKNIKESKSIRIKVINPGKLPDWHASSGNNSWIFLDEINVK